MWEPIEHILLSSPAILRLHLRRDFLSMLEYLRSVDTETGKYLCSLWLRVGDAVGISEQQLRDEAEQERTLARDDLVGCSWLKCACTSRSGSRIPSYVRDVGRPCIVGRRARPGERVDLLRKLLVLIASLTR